MARKKINNGRVDFQEVLKAIKYHVVFVDIKWDVCMRGLFEDSDLFSGFQRRVDQGLRIGPGINDR